MKFALFFAAAAFSGMINVLGTPTPGTTDVTTFSAPPGFEAFDVEHSVDASTEPHTFGDAASTKQYWVCIAVSESTFGYGWSQGGSEASALGAAKKKCGKGDCGDYSCVKEGCVGIDYGSHSVSLSYAYGYGSSDGTKAASKALSACKKHDTHCGKPGHFCAKYIR